MQSNKQGTHLPPLARYLPPSGAKARLVTAQACPCRTEVCTPPATTSYSSTSPLTVPAAACRLQAETATEVGRPVGSGPASGQRRRARRHWVLGCVGGGGFRTCVGGCVAVGGMKKDGGEVEHKTYLHKGSRNWGPTNQPTIRVGTHQHTASPARSGLWFVTYLPHLYFRPTQACSDCSPIRGEGHGQAAAPCSQAGSGAAVP